VERTCACKRKTIGAQQTNTTGGSESSIGSVVSGAMKRKYHQTPGSPE